MCSGPEKIGSAGYIIYKWAKLIFFFTGGLSVPSAGLSSRFSSKCHLRLKQRNQLWFTGEVRNMICRRNQALSKFRQTKKNMIFWSSKEYVIRLKEKFSHSRRLFPDPIGGKRKLFQKAMV